MTNLEWVLAHKESLDKESMEWVIKGNRVLDESCIRGCPHNYGLLDTEDCDATTCEDCWNQEVEE